jgi:hypothetical protein
MTRSDKTLIAVALGPVVAYMAIVLGVLAFRPSHMASSILAGGGAAVAMLGVGLANALRLRRDRKRRA